jgi:hypothetical protein
MSRSFAWTRWSGLAAVWGGVLGAAGSILATAAYYNLEVYRAIAPGWSQAVQPLLVKALTFADPAQVYQAYGRVFPLVFLLLLAGLLGLEADCLARGQNAPRTGFRMALIGLILMAFGSLADYWTGPAGPLIPEPGSAAWMFSFVVGFEVGALVYLAGAVWLGLSALRGSWLPGWLAWTLLAAPLLGCLLSLWGIRHIPGGFVLPVSLSWIGVGFTVWLKI